jgi:hypothetical protein
VVVAGLALMAAMPALAQLNGSGECGPGASSPVSQPSCASEVECAVPPADPADMCFENAFFPTGYPVVVDEGVVQTGPDSFYVCDSGSVPEGTLEPVQESDVQDVCNVRFGTPLPSGYQAPGQILGLDVPPPPLQYDNADTARCLDPLADHRGCSAWMNPDGSLSQA